MGNKKRLLIYIGIYFIIVLFVVLKITFLLIDKIAVVSFKKLYSAYSQALMTTVDEMGGETGCYYSSSKNFPSKMTGCDTFYKIFATNLKVTKYCKNNSLVKGCLPTYQSYAQTPNCAGFSENMMNRYNQTFVMNDKTSLTIFNLPVNHQNPLFAVDSNGLLFPNKAGFDLYSLVIMRSSNGYYHFHPNLTYCLPVKSKGIHNLQDVYK